ncbi:conserved Plasmodium protein, unknown function [Plasmodium knowlesi strain H]|uniref:RNA transcription, translation and transport factor protein n=3 Tax=Plasmodium knowlesi TaxID=5850 RepID=A0A5K1UUG8_PLAKH|nr:RNA transcription, translation and transport factor protein, putative [Plasmodium knowlesi strain H]OTN65045.1 Uncharacterized protein PKNOH_S120128600 [Plasmodium knowlesi]CAA9988149.1 RNA transcription, translation and transport factor protein, putative [Plasmodium knowlesi strain H]SBO20047.1 conserved Plasmodium protein, unknown function [Plasmodium knowlesi strain H]SBO20780.1 conserved Plasmodium protein, unknown function [Plasmodium knowlesi strain H]VVS77623.1 RNA transcription, tra|eukprot:XP_002259125.1 hypothetical protein, conserved in Plasmodium species [Plasmodium knowlesi strain H]
MNSLERKLKLLNYKPVDIGKDEFYYMILKLEEEKIRLYKPKEREKINYTKEKNYIEHILKYLKKLNINVRNVNKTNIHEVGVRTYILNSLATLALIDEYKDLVGYDQSCGEQCDNRNYENGKDALNGGTAHHAGQHRADDSANLQNQYIVANFFELNYLNQAELEEQRKRRDNLRVLNEQINEIFKKCDIPLLVCNDQDGDKWMYLIQSALHAIKEKLKKKTKTNNPHYESLFNFNISFTNSNLKDFAYITRYLLNSVLKERETHLKGVLNDIQMLTYNPVIDIRQGKVGR